MLQSPLDFTYRQRIAFEAATRHRPNRSDSRGRYFLPTGCSAVSRASWFQSKSQHSFCSALAVTPQRHDMDRKREMAGRMVRRKTLRARPASPLGLVICLLNEQSQSVSESSSRSDAGSLIWMWEGMQPCLLFWTIGHIEPSRK